MVATEVKIGDPLPVSLMHEDSVSSCDRVYVTDVKTQPTTCIKTKKDETPSSNGFMTSDDDNIDLQGVFGRTRTKNQAHSRNRF